LACRKGRSDEHITLIDVLRTNRRALQHLTDLSSCRLDVLVEIERGIGTRRVPSAAEPLGERRVKWVVPCLIGHTEPQVSF
jgi:hypothetical protein